MFTSCLNKFNIMFCTFPQHKFPVQQYFFSSYYIHRERGDETRSQVGLKLCNKNAATRTQDHNIFTTQLLKKYCFHSQMFFQLLLPSRFIFFHKFFHQLNSTVSAQMFHINP